MPEEIPPKMPAARTTRGQVAHAGVAVLVYSIVRNTDIAKEGRDTVFRDLLGDLMHYAQAWELDFDDELQQAQGHYNYETLPCEECGDEHNPDEACPRDEEDV